LTKTQTIKNWLKNKEISFIFKEEWSGGERGFPSEELLIKEGEKLTKLKFKKE